MKKIAVIFLPLVFLLLPHNSVRGQEWCGDMYHPNSLRQHARSLKILEGVDLSRFKRVLDVGCGTGRTIAHIAQCIGQGSALGVDLCSSMIEFARQEHASIKNLIFEVCSAEELSFDSEFDLVVSFAVFHWIQDQQKALHAVYKSLMPGGDLVVRTSGMVDPAHPIRKAFCEVARSEKWKKQFPDANIFGAYFPREKSEFEIMLQVAGFSVIDVEQTLEQRVFESAQEFKEWISGWAGGFPVVALLSAKDLDRYLTDVVQRFEDLTKREDGKLEYFMPLIIAKAKK
ncbi:MAG: methyltransferase domain-containing protein [Epsilonproteobacteria bacterium]|nr:methyltransferase domain-containing protein [Campylobacterota bacterium]